MHETQQRLRRVQEKRLQRNQTLIETPRLRALKRDIQGFLVSNSEFLNSTSRYHLVSGFERVVKNAQWKESAEKEKK